MSAKAQVWRRGERDLILERALLLEDEMNVRHLDVLVLSCLGIAFSGERRKKVQRTEQPFPEEREREEEGLCELKETLGGANGGESCGNRNTSMAP
jgi:hypothetical protein